MTIRIVKLETLRKKVGTCPRRPCSSCPKCSACADLAIIKATTR